MFFSTPSTAVVSVDFTRNLSHVSSLDMFFNKTYMIYSKV